MLFRTRGRPAGDDLLASPLFCFLEYSIISSRSTHIIGIFTLGDLLDKPWSQASTLLPPSELTVIFIAPMIQYSHRSSDSMLMFTNLRSRTSGVVDKPNEGASLLRGLNFQSRPSGTPIICTMKNARVQKPKKSTKLRFDFPDFFGIYLQGLAKTFFFFLWIRPYLREPRGQSVAALDLHRGCAKWRVAGKIHLNFGRKRDDFQNRARVAVARELGLESNECYDR